MALCTGTAELRDDDYFGQALNRVARTLASAHGGQVPLSLPTEELVRDVLPTSVQLRALGEHRLCDLARPEHPFQLTASDRPSQFPALRSLEGVPNNLPLQLADDACARLAVLVDAEVFAVRLVLHDDVAAVAVQPRGEQPQLFHAVRLVVHWRDKR